MHFDRSPFPRSCKGGGREGVGGGGGGGVNGLKFAIFIGRFRSDGAASMTMKGKVCRKTKRADNPQQTVPPNE